jgi:hypothetical protein
MSTASCVNCGRPTSNRQQDKISGRIVAICQTCEKSHSGKMFFMLIALATAVVLMMQSI